MRIRMYAIPAALGAHCVASYAVMFSVALAASWNNPWGTSYDWIAFFAPISAPFAAAVHYGEIVEGNDRIAWSLLEAIVLYCLIFAWLFTTWIGFWDRPRQHNHTRCAKCGYDLRATPLRCPECGEYSGQIAAMP